jgi:Fe-S-cluster containining protein
MILAAPGDKYEIATEGGPPCQELLPICRARCCTFQVALTTQDLDEGGLRWNYATPYQLAKDREGQCVHHDGTGCGVYSARPATCRSYDCREDRRVWQDYHQRILTVAPEAADLSREQLEHGARQRQLAIFVEASRLRRR